MLHAISSSQHINFRFFHSTGHAYSPCWTSQFLNYFSECKRIACEMLLQCRVESIIWEVKTTWHQEHTFENLLHALIKFMVQIIYVRFPLKWNTFRKNAQARPSFLLFPSNAAHTQLKLGGFNPFEVDSLLTSISCCLDHASNPIAFCSSIFRYL